MFQYNGTKYRFNRWLLSQSERSCPFKNSILCCPSDFQENRHRPIEFDRITVNRIHGWET